MADKNTVTEKPEEIPVEEKASMLNIFNNLPKDTFVKIPPDNIVYIGVSGLFIDQLTAVQNFITSLIPEADFEKLYIDMGNDFKNKDDESWTPPERFHMIMKELLYEIAFQGSKQKQDRIYDRNKVGEYMAKLDKGEEVKDKGIDPLTLDELIKRKTSNED